MSSVTREELLIRLFSSQKYMEEFSDSFIKGLDIAITAFSVFERQAQTSRETARKFDMELRQWRDKVIPNFVGMKKNAQEAKGNLKKNNTSTMRSATGNLHGLSKDMDGIGWEWWQEIDPSYWAQYVEHSNKAEQMASNIYYTLSDYWNPGEVTNESITGPISDESLKGQLRPGESL